MPTHTYVLVGRVLPERAVLDLGTDVGFQMGPADGVPPGELIVRLKKSQLLATYETSEPVSNIFTLRNIIEDTGRVILDVVGYHQGLSFDLDIVQVVCPSTDTKRVFGVRIEAVSQAAEEAGISVGEVFAALASQRGTFLRHALADLREAMKAPRDTGFFCYRAIEALRNSYNDDSVGNEAALWKAFRDANGLTREEIMQVKAFADDPRHGNHPMVDPISDAERADVLQKTWTIVSRFVETQLEEYEGPVVDFTIHQVG